MTTGLKKLIGLHLIGLYFAAKIVPDSLNR
jgi:hypothetical protein